MQDLIDEFKKSGIPSVVDGVLEDVFKGKVPKEPVGDMFRAMGNRMLQGLNGKWGKEGNEGVKFSLGEGGLVKATLSHGEGNTADVYLYGAHVARWSVGGHEALWMSPDADFEIGKPIRGGVPLCWPQFALQGDLPLHGFLRTSSDWQITDTEANENNVCLTLTHTQTAATMAVYAHQFMATYTIHLKPHTLTTSFKVKNTGTADMKFTTCMHTYIKLPHVSKAKVHGLQGLTYIDKVIDNKEFTESNEAFAVTGETDRIYTEAPEELIIDNGVDATITVHKSPSLPDAVVFNPWVARAKTMPDFNNYGWRNMICVEPAAAKEVVTLGKGKTWYGSQTLSVAMKCDEEQTEF